MLVKNWMSKDVITVDVNDSMQEATRILKEHKIRILPVMDKGKLVAVVSDRDLKKASASGATTLEIHELLYLIGKIKIKEIMTRDPITVPPDYTVEETAELLLQNKISGAPVVDNQENIVGIITQDDLFKVMISLAGSANKGVQFAFQIEDRPGSIKEITDIMRKYGCRLVSILSTTEDQPGIGRHVYIKTRYCDRKKLEKMKKDLRSKARMLYFIDHREHKRESYEEYGRPSARWMVDTDRNNKMYVKERVRRIASKGHAVNEEVIEFIKQDYDTTLVDLGKGIETMNETTREYLEGVEGGLKAAGQESRKILSRVAEILVETNKKVGEKSIDAARKKAGDAKASLDQALEKNRGSIEDVQDMVRRKMIDAYGNLLSANKRGKERLKGVGEGIRDYARQRKGDIGKSTHESLQKTADRASELATKLSGSAEKHTREFLNHPREKTAEWLTRLAEKLKRNERRL